MQNLSFSHRSWCRLVYGYQYFERCYWFDLKKWMGCKYGAVKVGTFMRFLISEDWNICEFIIFMVVPFVNCTCTHPPIYIHTHTVLYAHVHARTRAHAHTHTHTHTCTLCLLMECCTIRIPFFDGAKALKNTWTVILLTWRMLKLLIITANGRLDLPRRLKG